MVFSENKESPSRKALLRSFGTGTHTVVSSVFTATPTATHTSRVASKGATSTSLVASKRAPNEPSPTSNSYATCSSSVTRDRSRVTGEERPAASPERSPWNGNETESPKSSTHRNVPKNALGSARDATSYTDVSPTPAGAKQWSPGKFVSPSPLRAETHVAPNAHCAERASAPVVVPSRASTTAPPDAEPYAVDE